MVLLQQKQSGGEDKMTNTSKIVNWYNNRSIFITGGTGFMGKVLVEKLLYSCPGIKNIYILLRNKKGRTPQQRIEDMWKLPVFERLRNAQPEAIKKIVAINGDLYTEYLGLSSSDQQVIIDNVDIVFHAAATLKLEAKLKDAIEQNTAGTAKVIDLVKKIKNLKAFCHFSTAYCSADLDVFEEKVYESKDNPRDVIEITKWMNPEALEIATPSIIKPHPNTYTYSKRLAESLVADEHKNIPVCIVRPSIVTPAGFEPLPGWVDSLNGPIGLIVGAGKGVIRSMHCIASHRAQVIPVDYAINASIVATYKLGSAEERGERPKEVPVYNLTQDEVIQMTYGEVIQRGRKIVREYPFEMQVWYPDGDIRSSKLMHNICCIFMHWLPALFIDLLMFILRQKTFMIYIQTRVHNGLELLQFFTTRPWVFKSKHFLKLYEDLDPEEKDIFKMDFHALPIQKYLEISLLGARQYCMKEPLSSLTRCRIQQKVLFVLHKAFVFTLYYYLSYFICSYVASLQIVHNLVFGTLKGLPLVAWLLYDSDW